MANFMELAPRAQRQIIRRMEPLEPPALHQAQAAYGWLELGDVEEAFAELERLPKELQLLPAVQAVRLDCLMAAKNWNAAVKLAQVLCGELAEEPGLWLHYAYAARRCAGGSIEAAYELLAPCVERFPEEWLIPYNVACYLCPMDRLDEARAMLEMARVKGGERVDAMAKDDEDLAPLNL